MGLFRQLHKSAFWSQLLLGVVAILVLPSADAVSKREASPIAQTLNLSQLTASQAVGVEQAHFLQQTQTRLHLTKQGVKFSKLFANLPCFFIAVNPPIRAGP